MERSTSRTDWLYGATIFLASFLTFLAEPMAAKELLPQFGGAAAVWIAALLFFQVALLLGYVYARAVLSRQARVMHGVLLLCGALAAFAGVRAFARPLPSGVPPAAGIFALLALRLGLPFVLLASTTPLLQVWLARRQGAVPYRLFALSNAGSFLALVLYPALIEPRMTLRAQHLGWAVGWLVFGALSLLLLRGGSFAEPAEDSGAARADTAPGWRRRLLPVLLAAGGTLQLSAVTAHLTVNVAAMPLLWILPLAAYLLSFVVAFEMPGLYRRGVVVRLLVVLLASLGYLLSKTDVSLPIRLAIGFFVLELFVACVFLHAELYRLRPANDGEAATFYIRMAAGGAIGTAFVVLVSPMVFRANYDLPLSFFATAVLALVVTWQEGWAQRLLWATSSVLLLALVGMLVVARGRGTLLEVRDFYGALRVKQTAMPNAGGAVERTLLHGSIQHGTEIFGGGREQEPTTYYGRGSGAGLVLSRTGGGTPRRIGVVGLGAGTLAAYGQAGDRMTFFEIDPQVVPVARNLFTYLRASRAAAIDVVEGDARQSLERGGEPFDVLLIDAFSGDAVPLHLLTREAMTLYRRRLAPDGLVLFHVSNQYVRLAPEILLLADSQGWAAREVDSPADAAAGVYAASWVLVGSRARLDAVNGLPEAGRSIAPQAGLRVWTDDFSSLLPVLR